MKMLACLVLLTAGSALAQDGPPADRPVFGDEHDGVPACAAIAVGSPQQEHQGRGFSASSILTLGFEASIHERYLGGDGDHLLELRLYTPRGHLYQVLPVPFTLDLPWSSTERREVSLDRRRRPEPIGHTRQHEVGDGVRHQVSVSIPVAGGWIVKNSLYGSWRVDAYLDGSENACGRRRFRVVD